MTIGLLFSSLASSTRWFSASSNLSTLPVYSLITWVDNQIKTDTDTSLCYLDEVGHGEVHDVVFPRQLQNHVGVEEVVTLEQARSEAVVRLKKQMDTMTLMQMF